MATPLKNVSIEGCGVVTDEASGREVYHVATPHALIQAAGYLKFVEGARKRAVFFRGQRQLYATLSPTLYRGIVSQNAQQQKTAAIAEACRTIAGANAIFDQIPAEAHEPLLQHYGLNTSWLDLVDNIWVALWFACHRAKAIGSYGQYLHFERRDGTGEAHAHAYILLVAVDLEPCDPYVQGYWRGPTTELVDLRVAAPSLFLRPHAQHGVLFRLRPTGQMRPVDYASQVLDTIRIDLRHALAWLGNGSTLTTHSLFPPPYYDRGYSFLLENPIAGNRTIGGIQHIGS